MKCKHNHRDDVGVVIPTFLYSMFLLLLLIVSMDHCFLNLIKPRLPSEIVTKKQVFICQIKILQLPGT